MTSISKIITSQPSLNNLSKDKLVQSIKISRDVPVNLVAIASAIDKLITSGIVKELFLESNYSEQEYKGWIKLRDDWLNQNN